MSRLTDHLVHLTVDAPTSLARKALRGYSADTRATRRAQRELRLAENKASFDRENVTIKRKILTKAEERAAKARLEAASLRRKLTAEGVIKPETPAPAKATVPTKGTTAKPAAKPAAPKAPVKATATTKASPTTRAGRSVKRAGSAVAKTSGAAVSKTGDAVKRVTSR